MKTTEIIASIGVNLRKRLSGDKLRTVDSINRIMEHYDQSVADTVFALIDGTAPSTATAKVAKAGVVKKRYRRTNAEVAIEKAKLAAEKEAKKAAKIAAKSAPATGESDEQKKLREEYEKAPLPAQPTRGKGKVTQSPEAAVAVAANKDAEFATTAPF